MNIATNLIELIGNTPLLEVRRIEESYRLAARLLVKVEAFNPGGSVKDRAALAMIEDAEAAGRLKPGGTIIEPTSGNMGIGLAWIAAIKGYKVILTMPESMSEERRRILAAFGARLVLTPAEGGMKAAIAKAEELEGATPGAIIMRQFENPANPMAHQLTTAQELWRDTGGNIDYFVAGVGTGGTITGTARGLKAHNPRIRIVGVEPAESAVIEGGKPGPHKIQGIGAGFIPKNYDPTVVDCVTQVTADQATEAARLLASHEGLLAGISSGAVLAAAMRIAGDTANAGRTVVALLPDTGDRYLSTGLFS